MKDTNISKIQGLDVQNRDRENGRRGVLDEEKKKKFKELATKRTNRIIETLDLIGNLSGRNYKSDQEDVKMMFRVIRTAVRDAEKKFDSRNEANKFDLRD